ncbi:hypothetical protein CPB85DRAFT_1528468 [Mucidula mucida]|nr:hypothetical protein CPB85DRAFT_1528468 [Mucidula mucida]
MRSASSFKPKAKILHFHPHLAILELDNLSPTTSTMTRRIFPTLPFLLSEKLSQTLINKTSYVRKELSLELYTVLLNAEQSVIHRDDFVRDLEAILFAFVVETIDHKLAPSSQDAPAACQSSSSTSLASRRVALVRHLRSPF